MPTLHRESGLRFFYYSNESDPPEPAHIHVLAGRAGPNAAKFWLAPVELAYAGELKKNELHNAKRVVTERARDFKAKYDAAFKR